MIASRASTTSRVLSSGGRRFTCPSRLLQTNFTCRLGLNTHMTTLAAEPTRIHKQRSQPAHISGGASPPPSRSRKTDPDNCDLTKPTFAIPRSHKRQQTRVPHGCALNAIILQACPYHDHLNISMPYDVSIEPT